MKDGLTTVLDSVAKTIEAMRNLASARVMVGIPSDKNGRNDGPINSAALLYIHENGSPEANIPARPTLIPGVKDAEESTTAGLERAGRAAFDGNPRGVENSLIAVGLRAASSVKKRINSNTPPPLAPATLARRRARGVTRTNTLVDTVQMRNAVTSVVRKV